MAEQKQKEKFAAGSVLSAVWENKVTVRNAKQATLLKATFERRCKDKEEN